MKNKLLHMLQLQDRLNRQIDPHWLAADHAWYRAIWIEAAELLDHYGWKWWKAHKRDLEQIRLELVDIWHFGLSAELARQAGNAEQATRHMLQALEAPHASGGTFRERVETLALEALQRHTLAMPPFLELLQLAGMSFDDLYRIYVGKNVLNRFRQDHGYQEGHYCKIWDGREDNEHLAELSAALEADARQFEQRLYQALEARYPRQEAASPSQRD